MKRRQFIKLAGATTLSPAFTNGITHLDETWESRIIITEDDGIYNRLVAENDTLVKNLLEKQELDRAHRWFGGIPNNYGIYTASDTAKFIRNLTCALSSKKSNFYHQRLLVKRLELAAQYLLNSQHDDGTIDLHSTNFHSPPDTGFVLEPSCAALSILNQNNSSEIDRLKTLLKSFIIKAGNALVVGGIHTPNHRWVICRALARVNFLFPNPLYVKRIDEWLSEKIDIDPDGQFTEKSSAIYSPLTDRCLITVARLLDRPGLYEPVRRNLQMTIYYVHPDGEIVTDASRRQDKLKRGSMAPYYYPYRYMALMDNNGLFAAMAKRIEETAEQKIVDTLVHFIEDPFIKKPMPKSIELPNNYTKVFSHSDLVRIRRKRISATILAKNTTFFAFHKGTGALEALRFASAFFGKGQFQGQSLEIQNGVYVLRQKLSAPYYQPFPIDKRPDDGDWHKMPRSIRPQSEIQHLESIATISEYNGEFNICITIQGTDRVPVSVEFGFRNGGKLKGVEKVKDVPNAFILKQGYAQYIFEDNIIEVGPGQAKHYWIQLRGARPKLDAQSVYITGFTPFKMTFKIS
jgi:hypothetical protein